MIVVTAISSTSTSGAKTKKSLGRAPAQELADDPVVLEAGVSDSLPEAFICGCEGWIHGHEATAGGCWRHLR